jgi:hypothetical protein
MNQTGATGKTLVNLLVRLVYLDWLNRFAREYSRIDGMA